MRQIGRFVHVSKFDIDKILKTEKWKKLQHTTASVKLRKSEIRNDLCLDFATMESPIL